MKRAKKGFGWYLVEFSPEEMSAIWYGARATRERLTMMQDSADEGDRLAYIARGFGTLYEDGNPCGYDDWRDYVRVAVESEHDWFGPGPMAEER